MLFGRWLVVYAGIIFDTELYFGWSVQSKPKYDSMLLNIYLTMFHIRMSLTSPDLAELNKSRFLPFMELLAVQNTLRSTLGLALCS